MRFARVITVPEGTRVYSQKHGSVAVLQDLILDRGSGSARNIEVRFGFDLILDVMDGELI